MCLIIFFKKTDRAFETGLDFLPIVKVWCPKTMNVIAKESKNGTRAEAAEAARAERTEQYCLHCGGKEALSSLLVILRVPP